MNSLHTSVRLIDNIDAGKNQTIVTYGTSLTAGGQWVKDLRSWLDARYPGQATVINSGISGKASNTALVHLEGKVIAHKPDTVFIEFGTNDAFSYEAGEVDHGIPPEQSRVNLNLLIDRILAASPAAGIILQTMNPAWDAPNGKRSASCRPHLPTYYEGYRQVAAARPLLLIDHHANWVALQNSDRAKFESYIPDGVHPAHEGSTAITFREILRVLTAQTCHVP